MSVFTGPPSGAIAYEDADILVEGTEDDSVLRSGEDVPDLELGVGLGFGDLDGDGHHDLVASAPMRNEGDSIYQEGGAYVYFGPLDGSRYGIPDAPVRLLGDEDNDKFGGELEAGEDIDGDGQDDMLVGNGWMEINGNAGSIFPGVSRAAWVFYGPLEEGTLLARNADLVIQDQTVDLFGIQARVAGDTDGDGAAELLIGGVSKYLYLFDITATGSY